MNCEICQELLKRQGYMYYCDKCKHQFIFIKKLRDEVLAILKDEEIKPILSIKQETSRVQ